MCGIAGYVGYFERERGSVEGEKMVRTLSHRGPDDTSVWVSDGVVLAHSRLSILDLSSHGKQPMLSKSGRYALVYNGEIYNHLDIRKKLEPFRWQGTSDTETLLAAIELWGLRKTLSIVTGMFAFALWDNREKSLVLARDRLGEKPIYYGWIGNIFAFASELKALKAHSGWRGEIDRSALSNFMRLGYVPAPHSIYKNFRKLLPGSYLTQSVGATPGASAVPELFWSARDIVEQEPLKISDQQAIDDLEIMLKRSISRQMIADVPLGAFLSGGVDSSTVAALMQAQSSTPVRTFSIGFSDREYDEAIYAKAVADHLGTEHTQFFVTPADALSVIDKLPQIYDEPFGDASSIPTYLVSNMARNHVTVALSGDGGDELFGGYNRYLWGDSIWNLISKIPIFLRRSFGLGLTAIPPRFWDSLMTPFSTLLPRTTRMRSLGDKIHKLAGIIDVAGCDELYQRLISQHRENVEIVIDDSPVLTWAQSQSSQIKRNDFVERMMFHDLVSYLVDDILVKVDRAAMANSLETRVPLLDHSIVDFAWRLPRTMKFREGKGKWLLREVLYRYVPRDLVDRPKQGFSIPLDSWLRGELRDWAEALLDERRIREDGYLHADVVRGKWREHLSGRRNWQQWLWNVLMFQAWLQK